MYSDLAYIVKSRFRLTSLRCECYMFAADLHPRLETTTQPISVDQKPNFVDVSYYDGYFAGN